MAASTPRRVMFDLDGRAHDCGPDPDAPPPPSPAGPCSTHPVCEVHRRVAPNGATTTSYAGPDGRQHDEIPPCAKCGHPAWREGTSFTTYEAPTTYGGVPLLHQR